MIQFKYFKQTNPIISKELKSKYLKPHKIKSQSINLVNFKVIIKAIKLRRKQNSTPLFDKFTPVTFNLKAQ